MNVLFWRCSKMFHAVQHRMASLLKTSSPSGRFREGGGAGTRRVSSCFDHREVPAGSGRFGEALRVLQIFWELSSPNHQQMVYFRQWRSLDRKWLRLRKKTHTHKQTTLFLVIWVCRLMMNVYIYQHHPKGGY